MNVGWSTKRAAEVLNLSSPTKVSQSLNPAVEKIARLWRADATATVEMILAAVRDLDAMPDPELEHRERMLTGRADRSQPRRRR